MKKKTTPRRPPKVLAAVTLGHRVDPQIKEMLAQMATWRRQSQRETLEAAIRELYRSTGLRFGV